MSASPCFAFCGKPACRTLGCIHVYNARCQCHHSYVASAEGASLTRHPVASCPQHGVGASVPVVSPERKETP